jgi:pSer/pThr/pTyr-binding forkhead associated (FHA) protein
VVFFKKQPTEIVLIRGEPPGLRRRLGTSDITIGRDLHMTMAIVDHYASQRHCRLYLSDGEWLLVDLGSTNGTYLDRGKINAPTPVPIGVPILVGTTVLELR